MTELVELDRASTYILYVDAESRGVAELPTRADVRYVRLGRPPDAATAAGSRRSLRDLGRLARAVRADALDVFVYPSVTTYFPVGNVANVVGIHDAVVKQFPELTVPRWRDRALWLLKERAAIRWATKVFTLSAASRDALVEHLGLRQEEIAIVRPGVDPVFHPRKESAVERTRAGIGLTAHEPYVLFAGGISPHKDVETLLCAYAELPERPRLVIVGALESERYLSSANAVRSLVDELGLGVDVLLPGFVNDEDLAALYTGATVVALPSLAEGFGLPAAEAAACVAAVVLSDIPAHREVLGDAGLYFAPRDTGGLRHQLLRILGDESLRKTLANRGRSTAGRLTWTSGAERLRGLIAEAAGA